MPYSPAPISAGRALIDMTSMVRFPSATTPRSLGHWLPHDPLAAQIAHEPLLDHTAGLNAQALVARLARHARIAQSWPYSASSQPDICFSDQWLCSFSATSSRRGMSTAKWQGLGRSMRRRANSSAVRCSISSATAIPTNLTANRGRTAATTQWSRYSPSPQKSELAWRTSFRTSQNSEQLTTRHIDSFQDTVRRQASYDCQSPIRFENRTRG